MDMKTGIHPIYYNEAKVVCSCGNTFTTGSTKELIHIEICNKCHPLFTGERKLIDTEGRVEKFRRLQSLKREKKPKTQKLEPPRPKTLKEMLESLSE